MTGLDQKRPFGFPGSNAGPSHPDRKEETIAGTGFTIAKHQVALFAVIMAILVHVGVSSVIVVPIMPGPPMSLILVLAAPIFMMLVMALFVIGMHSITTMALVITLALAIRTVLRQGRGRNGYGER